MKRWARHHSRKDPGQLIDQIFTALSEQTVTVPGADAVELVIPRVAAQIKELKRQRDIVAEEVEKLVDDFPLSTVLTRYQESESRPQHRSSWPLATCPRSPPQDTWPPTPESLQ